MTTEQQDPEAVLYLRVPLSVKTEIEGRAKAGRWSLNSFTRLLIESELERIREREKLQKSA